MKAGDKIRVQRYMMGYAVEQCDFIVEEFRFCLGIFQSDQHRKADRFLPLCDLYERGPESKNDYISNFGEYYTNPVQAWMDLPRD